MGVAVSYLPVSEGGWLDPEELASCLRPETLLVSTMHVNNETGIELPLNDYAQVLEGHDAFWHVDAAQGFGKRNDGLHNKRIDMLSLSGHKLFAPKGIGALIARRRGFFEYRCNL